MKQKEADKLRKDAIKQLRSEMVVFKNNIANSIETFEYLLGCIEQKKGGKKKWQ